MKKFKVGQKIEHKRRAGYVYNVTQHDGLEWRGTLDHTHVDYKGVRDDNVEAHLGVEPKNWRLVKEPSEKDNRIAELTNKCEEISRLALDRGTELANVRNEVRRDRAKVDADQHDHDMKMLEAGYISIDALRASILNNSVSRSGGYNMLTQTEFAIVERKGLTGVYARAAMEKLLA